MGEKSMGIRKHNVCVISLVTSPEFAGSIPDNIIAIFIDIFLPPHYGHGVDTTSNRNEYPEYFLGVKWAGA
jgi:hypothetical protein